MDQIEPTDKADGQWAVKPDNGGHYREATLPTRVAIRVVCTLAWIARFGLHERHPAGRHYNN